MKEEWRPIKDYEDIYEVSNTGKVRSINRYECFYRLGSIVTRFRVGKELKQIYGKGDIPRVGLLKNGNSFVCKPVAYIVAETFIPNPNNYTCIRHLDSNNSNNSVDNLVWVPYNLIPSEDNMIDSEEWRPIPGYKHLYEVSSTGKVRSISRMVSRSRLRKSGNNFLDLPLYKSKELKPCRFNKKSGMAVYHLHERCKSGRCGQTDVYYKAEDLIQLAFPELYKKEN